MYEVVLMDIVQFALPLTLAMIAIVRGMFLLYPH